MKTDNNGRKYDILLDAFFPKQCICCNRLIEPEEELCDSCIKNIERIDPLKRCLKCGMIKEHCDCKFYVYHFEECIAPFYNAGLARRGFYDFKFKLRKHYGIFYAREMAKSVVSEFKNKKFDGIAYVPLSATGFLKRGFNQSKILAEYLSDFTGIPLFSDVLRKKTTFFAQHKRNRKQRFKRIRSMFSVSPRYVNDIKDRDILLVDDIKTTGATLDECARQLLFGGAKSVCCVTALITDNKFGKDEKRKKKLNAEKILKRFGDKAG